MESCRICDEPATRRLGAYAFCDRHYAHATRERGSVWRADLIAVAALLAFVVAVFVLDAVLGPRLDGVALTTIGLVIALIPAAVWLTFFYRRDRLEPEPKPLVVGVAVLGFLVSAAIVRPVLEDGLAVGDWLFLSPFVQLAGGILVVGFVQEFAKYAVVRFSVYPSREFDERTDGIVYMTAAGVGFATALNVAFVVDSGGVDLGAGSIRIAVTALAHASFAGITGYFLGRQKLEARPAWWMPIGLTIAATLNGLFFFVRGSVTRGGFPSDPLAIGSLLGLAMAGVLALVVSVVIARIVHREVTRSAEAGSAGPAG